LLEFGKLLDEGWRYKKSLSDKVSMPVLDQIYGAALKAGAIGGKILGAGGGGFLLLFVPPENQLSVKEQLKDLINVPVRFEGAGSKIVLYQPDGLV
jgi:D-glycero-alpha-D-manno-heptose-7-phosphate kinase